jgi:hypothetical protein
VNIRLSDYLLVCFCQRSQPLLRRVADWESHYLRQRLASIRIEQPVFITGLARAGTTLLLELLTGVDGAASHRYRDFPFLMVPYFWNRYLDLFPVEQRPAERAHQDRILITRESPEAMEEPLWQAFFPHLHSTTAVHRLSATDAHPQFEKFYLEHLRKILLIRGGSRYFAKSNYHLPRLEYLSYLFPDAHFIVPIRHPLLHIHSLVRQHELFCRYAAADARVPRYLAAAGHFEFGPQRVPIQLDLSEGRRILDAWSRGDEYRGYAIQWKMIYGFVSRLRTSRPDLAERVVITRYEDLCARPEATLQRLLRAIHVEPPRAERVFERLAGVSQSQQAPAWTDEVKQAIWSEVADVAEPYGYQPEML